MIFLLIIIAVILQIALFLAHWFLYLTAVRFLDINNPTFILILKTSLAFLSLTFVSASLLANLSDNIVVRLYYTFSAVWLGFFMYLFAAACLLRLGNALVSFFSFTLNTRLLAEIFFVLALAVGIFGIIEASFIRINSLTIRLQNLPVQWQGKTAVWLSDIHLGAVRNYEFSEKLAALIKKIKPDIVFIGGDLFDGTFDGKPANLARMVQPFSRVGAPLGTYFVTGNHEEFNGKEKFLTAVEKADIKVLNNEVVKVDDLQIIGVDYLDTRDRQKFKNILEQTDFDKNQASVLLKHAPVNIPTAQEMGISLQLSGHTHNGQIFPVGFISNILYRGYVYGLKHLGDFQIYISSGVGTWSAPLRVNAIPEIVSIKFE